MEMLIDKGSMRSHIPTAASASSFSFLKLTLPVVGV